MSGRRNVSLAAFGILAAVLVVVVSRTSMPPRAPSSAISGGLTPPEAVSPSEALSAEGAAGMDGIARESVTLPPATAPAASASIASRPAPPKKRVVDLEAKAVLELLVVDEMDRPVFDADVTLRGMRSETSPGSYYSYRGEPPRTRTDTAGRAKIEHWLWADIDGRTHEVDLRVSHPDFAPFRDSELAVGPGTHRVVLTKGAVVTIRPWLGSPGQVPGDVTIQMERQADLPSSAWKQEGDHWFTTQLLPGPHLVQVKSAIEGGPYYSEVVRFDLPAGGSRDLSIELRGATKLEGRLAEEVPRPVVDGNVLLVVMCREIADDRLNLYQRFEVPVREDGSFVIDNVSPGRGYLFVLTRGWVSRMMKASSARELGISFTSEATPQDEADALERSGDGVLTLPKVFLPQQAKPCIIAMEETGVVEIWISSEAGFPVVDVEGYASPNIRVPNVGSFLIPWRSWRVATDVRGVARIEDLPQQERLWIGAKGTTWRMRFQDRQQPPKVQVKAAQTVHAELIVEPIVPAAK